MKTPRPVTTAPSASVINAPLITLWIVLLVLSLKCGYFLANHSFSAYTHIFAGLPQELIRLRYSASVASRVVVILACLGTATRRNIFRQVLLAYAVFTLLIMYWKHPYSVFENIYDSLAAQGIGGLEHPLLAMSKSYLEDIILSLLLIHLLNHTKIKSRFT